VKRYYIALTVVIVYAISVMIAVICRIAGVGLMQQMGMLPLAAIAIAVGVSAGTRISQAMVRNEVRIWRRILSGLLSALLALLVDGIAGIIMGRFFYTVGERTGDVGSIFGMLVGLAMAVLVAAPTGLVFGILGHFSAGKENEWSEPDNTESFTA